MMPQDVITASLRMYNSLGSAFFSDEEMLDYIYFSEMDLANRAFTLQNLFTATTIAGVREYALPTNTASVKKVTCNGITLKKIDLAEDDLITGYHEDGGASGSPRFYTLWNYKISLRPVPIDSTSLLKIWTYNIPDRATILTSLATPLQYHSGIPIYCLSQMVAKDEKYSLSALYVARWEQFVKDVKKEQMRQKRSDSPAHVKDEALLQNFYIMMGRI